ncbi:unnamed protein product, partial [Dovyalis caffra]
MSVEDNVIEFEQLMLIYDINEVDECIMIELIGRLRSYIAHVVQLQQYHTLRNIIKLAEKMERHHKVSRWSDKLTSNREATTSASGTARSTTTNPRGVR